MNRWKLSICVAVVSAEVGMSQPSPGMDPSGQGVVIEQVSRHSAAERAGLRKGDVLISWRAGKHEQKIQSPFDLSTIETEHAHNTSLTLEGFRRRQRRVWSLGPGRWGLTVRPEFSAIVLAEYRESQALEARRSFSLAAKRCRAAATTTQKEHHAWAASWLMFRSASLWTKQRRWKEADEAYAASIRIAREAQASFAAILLRGWASSFEKRHDWTRAEENYKRSIAEYEESGMDLSAAAVLDDLGMMYWTRVDLKNAEDYCRKALNIRHALAPGSLAEAQSLVSVGTIVRYPRGSGLNEGEGYYNQALAIQEKLDPESLEVSPTLRNLGIIAWQRGDLASAQNYLSHALKLESQLAPESLALASTLNELSTVADLQGDLIKAEKYVRHALAIRQQEDPDSWGVSQSVHDLGLMEQQEGKLDLAEKDTQRALEIDRELMNDSLDVAGDLNDLAYIARDRGDSVKAGGYLRQALTIEEKVAPDGLYVAETLNALGDLSSASGDLETAQQDYQRCLAVRVRLVPGSEDHAATLTGLASVLRKKGELIEAEKMYEQTLRAIESQTAHLGGSDAVRSAFRARHAKYYRDYIELLLAENRPEIALEILERSRARMLLELISAAHVNIDDGVDPQLLQQEGRLRVEIAAKSDSRLRLLNSRYTEQELATIQKEIATLLSEYQEIEGQIRASKPRYAALTQQHTLSIREIQQQLDSETVLLEYSLDEKQSHVWVVSTDSLAEYELPGRSVIEGAARAVYDLLTSPNRGRADRKDASRAAHLARTEAEFRQTAGDLSRMILHPVMGHLGTKRLLVVKDGALEYVPFSVLPVVRFQNGSSATVPLLAEHEIVDLPSMSVLAELRRGGLERKPAPKFVAVLADPVFDKEDSRVDHGSAGHRQSESRSAIARQQLFWSSQPVSRLLRSASDVGLRQSRRSLSEHALHLNRLWFSRLEADTILEVTPKGQGLRAVDFSANRATATSPELAQYQVVHFATHGFLDSKNPELSGLVLSMVDSRGRPENGFLDLQDIYNLKLSADLVVLSACETALGKEIDGEGLVGLSQGFMYAGARGVVATLWRVSDIATAQLMKNFYRAMERDGMTPPGALRKAQLEMLRQEQWASPYYWAGFQLQGDWK